MGTQFFWIYDIVIVAIAAGVIFKCYKKGFVATLVGLLSVLIAFVVALWASDGISNAIYESVIRDKVTTEITSSLDDAVGDNIVGEIAKIDMSKATVNGKAISSLNLKADSAGKVNLDVSKLDLSKTGIKKADLTAFGISSATDYSAVKLGALEFTQAEISEYGIEDLLLAKTLSAYLTGGELYTSIQNFAAGIDEAVPDFLSGSLNGIANDAQSAIFGITKIIVSADTNDIAQEAVDNYIKPYIMIPVRALVFFLLFAILSVVLSLIAKSLKLINKIPLVGSVNSLLGALLGIIEAAIAILAVCIFIQIVVNITGNSIMVLNEETINQTIVFKYIYNMDFINFIN